MPASPAPTAARYLRLARGSSPTSAVDASGPPDVDLIRDVVRYEYRSMVIRQLQLTVEWQSLEWLDFAACRKTGSATQDVCRRCPVRAQCLAAAIVTDDHTDWRGGINCDERDSLWEQLESAFIALRDNDLMRQDRLVDGRGLV